LFVQAYCACTSNPEDLKSLLESSETVLFGTVKSLQKVVIDEVLKSSHSTTFGFVEVTIEGPILPVKTQGVFFGSVSSFESVMVVSCAIEVPDCILDSLRYKSWDLCPPEIPTTHDTGCETPHGHYPSGQTFIDPDTEHECTCIDGSLLCEPVCTCSNGETGMVHHVGETWRTTCQECSCKYENGVCGDVCDKDLCMAVPLGSVVVVLILFTIFFAIRRVYARRSANDDLELEVPRQPQPQQPNSVATQGGYAQLPTQPMIIMSQQGQPVVVQVAYI